MLIITYVAYLFIDAETSLVDVTQLKPELNDVDGVFQLGPADRCREVFVFSITVAFAAHLASVSFNFNQEGIKAIED